MPETPNRQTRYQMGSWTVTMLKNELRSRNMSPVGTKKQLLDRLERAESEVPGSTTPKGTRGRKPKGSENSPARSPSRVGNSPNTSNLTLYQLKSELRSRGLSPAGNKDALQKRLGESELLTDPFADARSVIDTPRRLVRSETAPSSPVSSPKGSPASGKRKIATSQAPPTAPVISKDKKNMEHSQIGLFRSPIVTLGLAWRLVFTLIFESTSNSNMNPWIPMLPISVLLFALAAGTLQGPHLEYLSAIKIQTIWYSKWVLLGIISSIGLGTGAHTFLLFLGPFIARVTTTADICGTLDFPVFGEGSFLCESAHPGASGRIAFASILLKTVSASVAWGIGTALGEFPPFLVARASALAGKVSGEIGQIDEIMAKPRKSRTWPEAGQLFSHQVVSRLGFFGIVLSASIPNPLFDLTGITCGYFLVPFSTFATATIIGKGFIKAIIQSSFVILIFSKEYMDYILNLVKTRTPSLMPYAQGWLTAQRSIFRDRKPGPTIDLVSNAWHMIIFATMAYFVLSVIRNAALIQAKKEGLIKA